jgi:hypothetical protein
MAKVSEKTPSHADLFRDFAVEHSVRSN